MEFSIFVQVTIKKLQMKYRLVKIIAALLILAHLGSCVSPRVRTNRRVPRHGAYHAGDRWW